MENNITPHNQLCIDSVEALFEAIEPKDLINSLNLAFLGYLHQQDAEPTTESQEIGYCICLMQSFIFTLDPTTANNFLDSADRFHHPLEVYHAQLSANQGEEATNG